MKSWTSTLWIALTNAHDPDAPISGARSTGTGRGERTAEVRKEHRPDQQAVTGGS